jgi:ubiquitin-protein ligase
MALHQRLLRDIAELQAKPYPNITLFPGEDITNACLVLRPNGGQPLHLTVDFGSEYPLCAPRVSIQSRLDHPNIFGSYICASILNTEEGYTSAYTLKGIAIQLLSFFSSDKLEQEGGFYVEDLTFYRQSNNKNTWAEYRCSKCAFGIGLDPGPSSHRSEAQTSEKDRNDELIIDMSTAAFPALGSSAREPVTTPKISTLFPPGAAKWRTMIQPALPLTRPNGLSKSVRSTTTPGVRLRIISRQLADLPDEILLLICNELDTEELFVFARAWNRIGGEEGVMTRFDLIRTRELQCFCLKKGFSEPGVQLGIGVNVIQRGRQGTLESEFDLLSLQAYKDFGIRRSVQGLRFQYWLPLPLSPRHYESVKEEVRASAIEISVAANLNPSTPVFMIYNFMNDVVVKLSQEASKSFESPGYREIPTSTLRHASEKAIESYFHLFHLLLCLATPAVVRSANNTLQAFLSGQTSKTVCPNLGYLLIAVLISDTEMTQELTMAIIKETVTRNVVWMLDARGAGMAELSYMEASAASEYRLQKTFEASKTSYRLLMFLNLLRLTTDRTSTPRKTLAQLREEMFDRHGAPPKGAATRLANNIKRIHAVNTFPDFLRVMGIQKMPTAAEFTAFLRRTVEESVAKGYSVWGLSQEKALALRRTKEPNVQVRKESKPEWRVWGQNRGSFFPNKGRR